jgi:hypothetical protein
VQRWTIRRVVLSAGVVAVGLVGVLLILNNLGAIGLR